MIGRLLGIDPGEKRIGLAVSDAMGVTARELMILPRRGDAKDFAFIREIAEQQGLAGIVVGVPQNPNAPAGVRTQADAVREWISKMRRAIPLPIAEVSEYLTSQEARRLARAKKRNPREPVDDLAARIILQSFLDALSYGNATFPPSETHKMGEDDYTGC